MWHDWAGSLHRGVNLGNALDCMDGLEAGLALTEEYFDAVAQAGFDLVRLPVRWSAFARPAPPYPIEDRLWQRADWAIQQALSRGLTTVVDVHHYHGLQQDPAGHRDRFLALWQQIATRYADRPAGLAFELLNEPHSALTGPVWHELLRSALATVRQSNPDRVVIVGPPDWNHLEALSELDLPDDGPLVATIHYYSPMPFTHQGAPWMTGTREWLGTGWGTDADQAAVAADLDRAAAWARQRGLPMFLGEFGAYAAADLAARARWTACVRANAERLGMSWCYWDFGTDFGVFDPAAGRWREPLRQALLPQRRGS